MSGAHYKLAQGVMALVKLHHADAGEVARYLAQYTVIKHRD